MCMGSMTIAIAFRRTLLQCMLHNCQEYLQQERAERRCQRALRADLIVQEAHFHWLQPEAQNRSQTLCITVFIELKSTWAKLNRCEQPRVVTLYIA